MDVSANARADADAASAGKVPLPPPPPPPPCVPPPPPPPAGATGNAEGGDEDGVMDPEQQRAMMEMLGLPVGFESTQGKKVEGGDVSAAKVVKERKFRQYMNRFGGFSRPLDED